LRPDLDDATFTGTVTVAFEVEADGESTLVLNAAELGIATVSVDGTPGAFALDEALERLTITTTGPLTAGGHTLVIGFDGTINDRLRGFYRSTYIGADGAERVIGTTQMQSTDCRRAFPCWDEPDFKAVFAITLVVDESLLAVSNSPEVSREPVGDGRVAIAFADTMPMSTYLVAFVVGPLEATEWVDVDGIPMRIVHVPGKGHLTAFGLEVGAFCLRWFQDYYGIPYPAEKVDLLALPDFAAGAMENLGCITFRENLLLVDPAAATQPERQLVADVVAHELAHMWFGDLVTMRWWNGIWLNEAFATFMELAACDAFRPDWERWLTFGLERSVAFETDALASTRPVEFEVRSPADAEGMFDVLTYQKGGALLRMLEQHLGEDRFRDGVRHYLRTHSYSNTETGDLWDAIEHTSGEPVRRIMDSWIWQPGFPLVAARRDGDELVLTQRRFSFGTGDADDVGEESVWAIPVRVRVGDRVESVLLEDQPVRLAAPSGTPVVVNADGHGFFRVDLRDGLLAEVIAHAPTGCSTLERYNLVDDAWNAVLAGRMGADELLDSLGGFTGERTLPVWQAIAVALRGLGRMTPEDRLDRFAARVRSLVTPAIDELGDPVDGEDDLTGTLRGLLVRLMATLGRDESTRHRCRTWFDAARAGTDIDPELVAAATFVVAATGGDDDYAVMLDGFRSAETPQEQLRHLYALAEFDDPALVARTCELALSGEVKTQNAPFLLRACIANRHHGAQAWEFTARNWDEANRRFPTNTIVRMVDSVKLLTDPAAVAGVQAFFAEHPIPQAEATLRQILERQRVNAAAATAQAPRLAANLAG
jgi:puromycin-sensitive aminopeptidase